MTRKRLKLFVLTSKVNVALGLALALVLVASEYSTFAALNSPRNLGSASAVGGTAAMLTMAVPLILGAVGLGGGLGYAYSLYLQSTRHAKLHTAHLRMHSCRHGAWTHVVTLRSVFAVCVRCVRSFDGALFRFAIPFVGWLYFA